MALLNSASPSSKLLKLKVVLGLPKSEAGIRWWTWGLLNMQLCTLITLRQGASLFIYVWTMFL